MSSKPNQDPRDEHTLDLSSGKKGKPKKTPKGFAPIVQQTIDLSMPKGDDFEAVNEIPNPKAEKSGKPAKSATSAPRLLLWPTSSILKHWPGS